MDMLPALMQMSRAPFLERAWVSCIKNPNNALNKSKNLHKNLRSLKCGSVSLTLNLKIRNQKHISMHAEETNVSPVMSPRDAFFLSRCNAFKLYHECDENE